MFDARDVLLKAAERISEKGAWCQGAYISGQARCAIGMLDEVTRELDVQPFSAENLLREHLNLPGLTAGDLLAVAVWNDAPDRTAHEVADAMRAAAS